MKSHAQVCVETVSESLLSWSVFVIKNHHRSHHRLRNPFAPTPSISMLFVGGSEFWVAVKNDHLCSQAFRRKANIEIGGRGCVSRRIHIYPGMVVFYDEHGECFYTNLYVSCRWICSITVGNQPALLQGVRVE